MKPSFFFAVLFFVAGLYRPAIAQQWESAPCLAAYLPTVYKLNATPEAIFIEIFDGLYRSLDGGESWSKVRDFPAQDLFFISILEVNPYNGRVYYVGKDSSASDWTLIESADLGNSWQIVPMFFPYNPGLAFIQDTAYAIDGALNKVYKRHGTSGWQLLPTFPSDSSGYIQTLAADGNHLWVAGPESVMHSPDAGQSWEKTLTLPPTPPSTWPFTIQARNGLVFLRLEDKNWLYYSGDLGQNWELYNFTGNRIFDSGQHIYSADSLASKYLLRLNGPAATWDTLPLSHHATTYLAGVGENDGTIWMGVGFFGVARKKPDEARWFLVNNPSIILSECFKPLHYYDGQLLQGYISQTYSSDDAASWEQPFTVNVPDRIFQFGNEYFGATNTEPCNFYYAPANGRFEWRNNSTLPKALHGLTRIGDTLFANLNNNTLYRSVNQGYTWTNLGIQIHGNVAQWQGNLFGLRDSLLLRSSDGGQSWQTVHNFSVSPVGRFFAVADTFLVCYAPNDRIYRSTDAGQTFELLTSPEYPASSSFNISVRGKTIFLSLGDNNIYVSRDLGTTWLTLLPPYTGYNWHNYTTLSTASDDAIFLPDALNLWKMRFDGQIQANGVVFLDLNGNGTQQTNEAGLNGFIVKTDQQNVLGNTYGNGNFSLLLAPSADTVRVANVPAHYISTPPFRLFNPANNQPLKFGLKPTASVNDVAVQLAADAPFRAGFANKLIAEVRNAGTLPATGQLKVAIDPLLTVTSTEPLAANQIGDTLVWDYVALGPLEKRKVVLEIATAVVPPGTPVSVYAEAAVGQDVELANNATNLTAEVVASYDPNDKAVSETAVPLDQLGEHELSYTIRFQNLGNIATDFIIVRDTLSDAIDPASIRILLASHPYEWTLEGNRVLVFRFNPIALTPAMADSVNSQGFIQFAARLRPNLVVGADISNTAHIYFDYNPAVVTNTVHTVVEAVSSVFAPHAALNRLIVFPNPAFSQVTLQLPHDETGVRGQVEILTAAGRVIRTEPVVDNAITLSVADWPTGMYWCRWQIRGTAYWGKIAVQR